MAMAMVWESASVSVLHCMPLDPKQALYIDGL
jgi:hypothetical protein